MARGHTPSNFLSPTVIEERYPAESLLLRIAGRFLQKTMHQAAPISRQMQVVVPLGEQAEMATSRPIPEIAPLEPGEWVEVRPFEEIIETLDAERRFRGLYFMPEMEQFCGGTFRVFKKVSTIKLESTGEVRRLKSPAVSLEGVYCSGEQHEGCDRACFHFWREAWLRRIPGPEGRRRSSASPVGA